MAEEKQGWFSSLFGSVLDFGKQAADAAPTFINAAGAAGLIETEQERIAKLQTKQILASAEAQKSAQATQVKTVAIAGAVVALVIVAIIALKKGR